MWPEHKGEAEVLELEATTPDLTFNTTYQGRPVVPGGSIFQRKWLRGRRYDITDRATKNLARYRYMSWDTAISEKETAAYTVNVVGELMPDHRLLIRDVFRERVNFPDLTDSMGTEIGVWNFDYKLSDILIEVKGPSGLASLQMMAATDDAWWIDSLVPISPSVSKEERANLAAAWVKAGMVWLPYPDAGALWLAEFEKELFGFPNTTFSDQVDAFSQLVLYLGPILEEGYFYRREREQELDDAVTIGG